MKKLLVMTAALAFIAASASGADETKKDTATSAAKGAVVGGVKGNKDGQKEMEKSNKDKK